MATASIKIVLRKRKNKDGTRPLVLQIIKNRKTSILHTGQDILEADWDAKSQKVKKSHPNSARINNYLLKKLAEANAKSLEMEDQNSHVSSKAVKENIKPSGGTTFFAQAELYLNNLKTSGKYNQYTADKPRVKHFRDFLKESDIAFSDISVGLLQRYQAYLHGLGDKGQRTIVNHLVVIRSVFAYAAKNRVIDKKLSPFGKEGIKIKFPDSVKIGLTAEEVKRLEELTLPEGSFEEHARKLWLFSFYFAGMRIGDVLRLKWSDLQNERLYYSMGKNDKGGSLKVSSKALKILYAYEKEKRNGNDFVFPDLKRVEDPNNKFILDRTIAFTASRIDKFLQNHVAPVAKIEKPLTMHIARHTFGNISGDKIPIQMLQKLYRHSHITTTIGYQANFLFKDADEALESVIGID